MNALFLLPTPKTGPNWRSGPRNNLFPTGMLIPPPSSVLRSFWSLLLNGQLKKHFVATLLEFAYGFSAACVIGVLLGYFMGLYKWFDDIMEPWIATLYSIPIITVDGTYVPLMLFNVTLTVPLVCSRRSLAPTRIVVVFWL